MVVNASFCVFKHVANMLREELHKTGGVSITRAEKSIAHGMICLVAIDKIEVLCSCFG